MPDIAGPYRRRSWGQLLACRSVSLLDRPRLRAPINRLARWALAASDDPAGEENLTLPPPSSEDLPPAEVEATPPAQAQPLEPSSFARDLPPWHLAFEGETVTRLLYERLSSADVAETEQLIRDTPGAWDHYAAAPHDAARRQLILAFGMWLGSDSLPAKTGLVRAEPPDEVHSMTRGAFAAAGGLYEADLIADALIGVGVDISTITEALDFGCSSGRVLRVLHAAYPAAAWHGCDPNTPAITWASENLPGIDFFANGDAPPLQLADESLDLAYAISIWSHFAPELGLSWFEEMRRLLRPGGYLVCTTHGMTSVAHDASRGHRSPEQSQDIAEALYRHGVWYAAEFGDEGDWGVVNPAWGTAFITPEWLMAQLCPVWRVLEFAPGRNQDNQDVYVLQRA
jgi:SAM-dependent methyltransferase